MLGWLTSNLVIKILVGAAVVVAVVGQVEGKQGGDKSCVSIENYPNRSAVYQCEAGLSTVYMWNNTGKKVYASVTTDVQAEAWLTVPGDKETLKTLPVRLGAPVVLGPGAFMAVGNGSGLIYIHSVKPALVSIAWDHAPAH